MARRTLPLTLKKLEATVIDIASRLPESAYRGMTTRQTNKFFGDVADAIIGLHDKRLVWIKH